MIEDRITTAESLPIFIWLAIGGTAAAIWTGAISAGIMFASAGIIVAWCTRLLIRRLEVLINAASSDKR